MRRYDSFLPALPAEMTCSCPRWQSPLCYGPAKVSFFRPSFILASSREPRGCYIAPFSNFALFMAEICEATKASCEPRALGVAVAAVAEVRRLMFVPTMAEDECRKRKSLDSGTGCDENRGDHGDETGNGGRSGKKATIGWGVSGLGKSVAYACPRYGAMSVCGRRREMEDAISIRPDFVRLGDGHHFFGVFHGHGCSHVAESCRDRMHEMVAEEISTSMPGQDPEWAAAMERSFARMDVEGCAASPAPTTSCRCELQTPKCDHVGSTAVVAVVGSSRIVVANCGDSRAVLCRNGVAVPLSTDHKPDRPDELQRIESAGGRIIYWDGARVLGVLAMSRAIGDSYLKPYVIPVPEVTITERLEGDECFILASDGLWDVVSNEMACDIARTCLRNGSGAAEEGADGSEKACSDAAILLTKLALARHSMDNITVVVVDLRRS